MFSQASVILSRGVYPRADTPQADIPPLRHPPSETATAVDGTHLTGMHSCFYGVFALPTQSQGQRPTTKLFVQSCASHWEKFALQVDNI